MIRRQRKKRELAIIDAGHVAVAEGAHAECYDALEGGEFGEPFHAIEVVGGAEELATVSPVELGEGFAEAAVFGLDEGDGTGGGSSAHFEVLWWIDRI